MDKDQVLEEFDRKFRRCSTHTKRNYRLSIGRWLSWLNGRDPSQQAAQEYLDYLIEAGRAPNSITATANALRKFAVVVLNTAYRLEAPSISFGTPKYLEVEQVNQLLNATISVMDRCLVGLLFDTGARISEILNLKVEDINWEQGFLRVTRKGGDQSDVVMTEKGKSLLQQWMKKRKPTNHPRVFLSYTYWEVRKRLMAVAKRAGISNFTIHRLRHSRAVQLRLAGYDINIVQQIMGHKSVATTVNIYGRFKPEELRKKLEAAPW